MLIFASICPHPPLLLPSVGSEKDRALVQKTIKSLEYLGKKLKGVKPDSIIISSPHPDWGIKVPLYFLIASLKDQNAKTQFKIKNYQNSNNILIDFVERSTIYPILTTPDSPRQHYDWAKEFYKSKIESCKLKIALVASGDLSHCLKEDGPYGFQPDGPKFDSQLIKFLKEKNIEGFLKLDEMFPQAGECGLRSFCFALGILEEAKIDWQPEILSYEAPFGVGYLVADLKIKEQEINV